MKYRLAGATYRVIAEKLTEERAQPDVGPAKRGRFAWPGRIIRPSVNLPGRTARGSVWTRQRAAGPSLSARNASVAASRSRHTTFWFAKIPGMVYASETATV